MAISRLAVPGLLLLLASPEVASAAVLSLESDLFLLEGNDLHNLTRTRDEQEVSPSVSPGGDRIAFVDYNEAYLESEIYVRDLEGGAVRRLSDNEDADVQPAWSHDGKRLAWIRDHGQGGDLVVADRRGRIAFTFPKVRYGFVEMAYPAWHPHQERIAFAAVRSGTTGAAIYLYDLKTGGIERVSEGNHPVWSPDGRSLAFTRRFEGWTDRLFIRELAARTEREVAAIDLAWQREIGELQWHEDGILFVEMSAPRPELELVAVTRESEDGTTVDTGKRIAVEKGTDQPVGKSRLRRILPSDDVEEVAADRSGLVPVIAPLTATRCQVSSIVKQDQYSSWVKFKATLTGNCGFSTSLGTYTSVQYFVDGTEVGYTTGINRADWECKNMGGPVITEGSAIQWIFRTTGSHTIGARVVEWSRDPIEGGKVCDSFSPIVTKAVSISVPTADADTDSIPNTIERNLYDSYRPLFLEHPSEPFNLFWITLRVGPALSRSASPITMNVVMNYNALWDQDGGQGLFCGSHAWDTEPMGYLLVADKPYSQANWYFSQTVAVAHDGTVGEDADLVTYYERYVSAAKGKHGLHLPNRCSGPCDECGIGTTVTPGYHNVGNGKNKPGNCGDSVHLVDGDFLVPAKWTSIVSGHFGKYSPFAP